jgi:hypothetical protein
MKQSGVGQGVEERPWQFARRIGLVGTRANQRSERPRGFERG